MMRTGFPARPDPLNPLKLTAMKTTLPKGARLLAETEVPAKGDFARWSQSKRDSWIEIGPRLIGLPVATLRVRHGQSEMQFCTFAK